MNGAVLVLNQNYEPLNVCNLRRAILLVFDGKAESWKPMAGWSNRRRSPFPAPSVIRMMYLIHRPRPRVKLTRKEAFIRDGYTCQYCGRQCYDLTIDHVIPARAGVLTLGQPRLGCKPCNHRKGGKLLTEVYGQALRKDRTSRGPVATTRSNEDRGRRDQRVVEFLPGFTPVLSAAPVERGSSRAAR